MNNKRYKDALYEVRKVRDLRELIHSSVELFENRRAFLVKDKPGGEYRPVTYKQMSEDMDCLGTSLLARGLGGQKVAVIAENRYEWVLSYFAVCCGTGIFVPIERELSAEDVKNLLARSGATAVIYSKKTKNLVDKAISELDTKIRKIHMDIPDHSEGEWSLYKLIEEGKSLIKTGNKDFLDAPIDPEAMSLLLFTSGTTGTAKGVMLSHKNLVSNVMSMSMYVSVSGAVGLSVLPMHHTYEMTCHILTALYQGCTVAICEGLKYITKNMAEAKVNVVLGVPLIFEAMYKRVQKQARKFGKEKRMNRAIALSKKLRLSNTGLPRRIFKEIHDAVGGEIKLLISGAAAMDPEIVESFCAMGLPLIQGYGMTESSPIIAVNRDRYSKAASVGTALPGTKIRIIDPDENGIGEIICKSDSVMLGYYDDPEETARVLKNGWLHTGDYGYLDEDKYLYITGRKKNVIVTKNGKNIFPEEVESHLAKSDYVRESLVYGVDEQCGGETIVCAKIVPDYQTIEEQFGSLTENEIRRLIKEAVDAANERMPLYKRIKRFEIQNTEFAKTPSRKIKRHVAGKEEKKMDHKDYEALKAKEWEYAVSRAEGIKNSKDPLIRYKKIRPIIDIKHMFETSVALYGDNTAFHTKDEHDGEYRQITYKETKADVDALGTSLIALGLSGKSIAIIGENSYRWAISYLAVTCGTGIVVPLDKELPAEELEQLVREGEVECVICSRKFEPIFAKIKAEGRTKLAFLISMEASDHEEPFLPLGKLIESGKELLAEGNRDFLDAVIERDVMGILLFTSGTTGVSKGVMLSHGNIVEDLMASPTLVNVDPEDVFFSVLPIHHTYECTCGFLMPLYRGASIAYCEGLKYILKNLSEVRPTMFLTVPLIMESIYKRIWAQARKSGAEKKLRTLLKINRFTRKIGINLVPKKITDVFGGRMRIMICGGAAIDPAILEGIQDFGIMAVQGYGLTECAPICALNPDVDPKSNSVGYIPPGFDLKIDSPDPETGIGEICAKGGNIMLGYFKNEEATKEALKDGWFHTGDLGYMDEDNFAYITGRKKNVIITKNGKNVFPEEIEYYLGRVPYVSESLVWGKDSEDGKDTVISANIKVDEEAVAEALGESYTDEQVLDLLWKEVDKINEELPFFKKIKKMNIRKTDFEKTTGKKIKRFIDSNKE